VSSDADRIQVPTNGRGPHPAAAVITPAGPAAGDEPVRVTPDPAEPADAVSPRQLAIGLGILASLVLLVAGRAFRRRSGG
jgi:hypothetical protein